MTNSTIRNQRLLDKFKAENKGIRLVGNRKLIYGIGINDADYPVRPRVNGKQLKCVFYQTWQTMMKRCYSDTWQSKNPTYKGCTVCNEWHSFVTFKAWMKKQNYEGNQLDKDILVIGNKQYAPDKCAFVSKQINSLMTASAAKRGKFPQGVHFDRGKYIAQLGIKGKLTHIGVYTTAQEAEAAYIKAKSTNIIIEALEQPSTQLMKALVTHAKHMRTNFECKQQAMA